MLLLNPIAKLKFCMRYRHRGTKLDEIDWPYYHFKQDKQPEIGKYASEHGTLAAVRNQSTIRIK